MNEDIERPAPSGPSGGSEVNTPESDTDSESESGSIESV